MFELMPFIKQSWVDANGAPLAGGLINTYSAGTSTPLATYTDSTGATPNTNPVVLDSSGRANIWISNNSYKFIVTDSLGNLICTEDNVMSIASQIAAISTTFQKVVVSYSQLQTAALSNAIQVFQLPAKSILGRVIIKHSTNFTGGIISAMQAQIGPSGSYQDIIEGFDVFQAVGDQVFDASMVNYLKDYTNPTAIYLNAVAVGANLSALTQGSLTVWYEYETLP